MKESIQTIIIMEGIMITKIRILMVPTTNNNNITTMITGLLSKPITATIITRMTISISSKIQMPKTSTTSIVTMLTTPINKVTLTTSMKTKTLDPLI